MILLILLAVAVSFALSASAGLGGSLLLVPALSLALGAKQGIALAALLLACNNVAKLAVFRKTIPWKAALGVLLLTVAGAYVGARMLLAAPAWLVNAAMIAGIALTFLLERLKLPAVGARLAPLLAFFSGASSGFSGTSGPLKGVAIKSLNLERAYFLGAASLVSFAGDLMKTAVFSESALLDGSSWMILFASLPLMPLAAMFGRRLNSKIGERAFAGLFWTVMVGYSIRVLVR